MASAQGQLTATNGHADDEMVDRRTSHPSGKNQTAIVSKPLTFSDLPVELQLEIFKLIFVRQETQVMHISQYKTLKVVNSANLSAQFLGVCKMWNEYGSRLLLENVFTICLVSNIQKMIKASVD